ncbi:MAG: tetraacyldisaccharide 4'-kinase [bacterium]
MKDNTIDLRPSIQKIFNKRNNNFLFALSGLYYVIMTLRNRAFKEKLIKIRKAPCSVISVGNITVGGSGKTPVVCFLARRLKEKGFNVAIISRGYKRKNHNKIFLVSNGTRILASPHESGDEPYMIARSLPDIPVIVGKDRYQCCVFAQNTLGTNIALLDDAYQHQYLYRDVNILIINGANPFGNGNLLPGGILREPLTSMRRADIIVINKMQNRKSVTLTHRIKRYNPNAALFNATYDMEKINAFTLSGKGQGEISLKGKSAVLFSGIGDPSSLKKTVEDEGILVHKQLIFADHHWYSDDDMDTIVSYTEGVDCIITTEKDLIRLQKYFNRFPVPIFTFTMKTNFVGGESRFIDACISLLKE